LKDIRLTKQGAARLSLGLCDFYERDISESIKSFQPGQWVYVDEGHIGFINPHVLSGPVLRIVTKSSKIEESLVPDLIKKLITRCFEHRTQFKTYKNYRLCYGDSDKLPGLIVDVFENVVLVQINTAGLDKYRNHIKLVIEELFGKKDVFLFDNEKYRKNEVLPVFDSNFTGDVLVNENNFNYKISNKSIQKVGYYFDHRENREKLETFLSKVSSLNKGMDLFCYTGSWGLHLLRGGVQEVDFIDQADMSENIDYVIKENNFDNRGKFTRRDVFSHLDLCIQNHERFDIIVNDPPAFSKSEKNRHKAIGGYEKLHYKALQLLNEKGFYVAASCTHGVSLEDLDKSVLKAARRLEKNLVMLDVGAQGFDHPFASFESKSFYIKYLLYQVYE
jgi:23S rRNA (cytosine1962-C5)-methyltransferase